MEPVRCRDEWDLLRRHYRHVAVFAYVEQAHKDKRTDSRIEIAGFRFNAGLSAGCAGETGIECTDADSGSGTGRRLHLTDILRQAAFFGAPVRRGTLQRVHRNPASPISLIARRRSR